MTSIGWQDYEDPGTGILFMKVGTHANESLDDILVRKRREIDEAGFALWGYGGNTCHPTHMVQPFAAALADSGHRLVLAMQPMNSKHFADAIRAEQYSVDGGKWETIPEAVNALGSRFALWIDSLETVEVELPLAATEVAHGRSKGRRGDRYVNGRVDKACLTFSPVIEPEGDLVRQIQLIANVAAPHAVFLR